MRILRSWREQKIMLIRRFSCLTDQDFNYNEEQREDMMDKLSLKLNKTREELTLLFAELQTY